MLGGLPLRAINGALRENLGEKEKTYITPSTKEGEINEGISLFTEPINLGCSPEPKVSRNGC